MRQRHLLQRAVHYAAIEHFRALGYRARGGIERDMTERDEANGYSFPHFSASFFVGGTTYPRTPLSVAGPIAASIRSDASPIGEKLELGRIAKLWNTKTAASQ